MHLGGRVEIAVKSLDEPMSIWGIGDIHLLNRGCWEAGLDANLKRIADDPHAYWVGLGDYADLISYRDRRFDPGSMEERDAKAIAQEHGDLAIDRAYDKLMPVADKCLGLLEGNHEHTYGVKMERRIVSRLVKRINEELTRRRGKRPWNVPYLGYSAFRDVVFMKRGREVRFRLCLHHGAGAAQTKGGKLNRLDRFMQYFDADLYLMGHVHTVTDDSIVVIGADDACEHLTHRTRAGVICGSYLRTYSEDDETSEGGYGERAMYEPVVLGSPRITIMPGSRELGVVKPL